MNDVRPLRVKDAAQRTVAISTPNGVDGQARSTDTSHIIVMCSVANHFVATLLEQLCLGSEDLVLATSFSVEIVNYADLVDAAALLIAWGDVRDTALRRPT